MEALDVAMSAMSATPRYYVAAVAGLGTSEAPYGPAIPPLPAWSVILPSNANGSPQRTWCLVECLTTSTARMDITQDVIALPALDVQVSAQTIASVLALTGVTVSGLGSDVVRQLGQALEPGFQTGGFGANSAAVAQEIGI